MGRGVEHRPPALPLDLRRPQRVEEAVRVRAGAPVRRAAVHKRLAAEVGAFFLVLHKQRCRARWWTRRNT